jgi:hypothetical protein
VRSVSAYNITLLGPAVMAREVSREITSVLARLDRAIQ